MKIVILFCFFHVTTETGLIISEKIKTKVCTVSVLLRLKSVGPMVQQMLTTNKMTPSEQGSLFVMHNWVIITDALLYIYIYVYTFFFFNFFDMKLILTLHMVQSNSASSCRPFISKMITCSKYKLLMWLVTSCDINEVNVESSIKREYWSPTWKRRLACPL